MTPAKAPANRNDHVSIKFFGLAIEGTAGCAKLVTWLAFLLLFAIVLGGRETAVSAWKMMADLYKMVR
jgi:hypothetical protein